MIIYHNPRCSKSRQALGLLKENGEEPDVIEYLLRVKEDEYSELGLSPDTPAEDILTAIALNPILLERPIIVKGRRAVIARPPELVEDLL
jgi:arsenate reductase